MDNALRRMENELFGSFFLRTFLPVDFHRDDRAGLLILELTFKYDISTLGVKRFLIGKHQLFLQLLDLYFAFIQFGSKHDKPKNSPDNGSPEKDNRINYYVKC